MQKNSFKFPAKYAGVITAFFLSLMMTCIVSLVSSIRAVGFTHDTLMVWVTAWPLSWLFAFPVLLFILPIAKTITMKLVYQAS